MSTRHVHGSAREMDATETGRHRKRGKKNGCPCYWKGETFVGIGGRIIFRESETGLCVPNHFRFSFFSCWRMISPFLRVERESWRAICLINPWARIWLGSAKEGCSSRQIYGLGKISRRPPSTCARQGAEIYHSQEKSGGYPFTSRGIRRGREKH